MTKTLPPAELLWDEFDYDPLKGQLIRKKTGNKAYRYGRYKGFRVGEAFYEHRLVWKWVTGSDPVGHIDHRNRNRYCNQFWNLRVLPDWLNRWTTTKPGYVWLEDRQRFMGRVIDLTGKKRGFSSCSEAEVKQWVLKTREEIIQEALNTPGCWIRR